MLEILIAANTEDLLLAEVEGDALFFYKESEIPSLEKILAQVENIFTAFYSHLKLLEKNRICPCHACSSAPKLQLKIIIHCGEIQLINVSGKSKPFGPSVIAAHRLLKNSIDSDNYVLLSKELADHVKLSSNYQSKLYQFEEGSNEYDGQAIDYLYSVIKKEELKLKPFAQAKKVNPERSPTVAIEQTFPIPSHRLLEYITNYSYRYHWVKGVDKFEYNENEVTRLGTEHVCVINDKLLNFVTITKDGKPGQIVYGEEALNPPLADEFYQFYLISSVDSNTCKLEVEIYLRAKSFLKNIGIVLFVKNVVKKNTLTALSKLQAFIYEEELSKQ